jgi:hypothetical protein
MNAIVFVEGKWLLLENFHVARDACAIRIEGEISVEADNLETLLAQPGGLGNARTLSG